MTLEIVHVLRYPVSDPDVRISQDVQTSEEQKSCAGANATYSTFSSTHHEAEKKGLHSFHSQRRIMGNPTTATLLIRQTQNT